MVCCCLSCITQMLQFIAKCTLIASAASCAFRWQNSLFSIFFKIPPGWSTAAPMSVLYHLTGWLWWLSALRPLRPHIRTPAGPCLTSQWARSGTQCQPAHYSHSTQTVSNTLMSWALPRTKTPKLMRLAEEHWASSKGVWSLWWTHFHI